MIGFDKQICTTASKTQKSRGQVLKQGLSLDDIWLLFPTPFNNKQLLENI